MTEQNANEMLQQMLAARVSELIQNALFPHEVQELVDAGSNEIEDVDSMNEEQSAMVKRMHENHVVESSDEDSLRSLHIMQLGDELYAVRDPADIAKFRASLEEAGRIFDEKTASGEIDEPRSNMLDLEISHGGLITNEQIESVKENAMALLDVTILPCKVGETE